MSALFPVDHASQYHIWWPGAHMVVTWLHAHGLSAALVLCHCLCLIISQFINLLNTFKPTTHTPLSLSLHQIQLPQPSQPPSAECQTGQCEIISQLSASTQLQNKQPAIAAAHFKQACAKSPALDLHRYNVFLLLCLCLSS